MLNVNKYGACFLPVSLDTPLRDKCLEIAALTKEMTPTEARVFEQIAVSALTSTFAEARLRKGMEIRKKERKNG